MLWFQKALKAFKLSSLVQAPSSEEDTTTIAPTTKGDVSEAAANDHALTTSRKLSLSTNHHFFPSRLGKDEIRLLEIHAAAYGEPVSCSHHVENTAKPSRAYHALSYCWGDPEESKRTFRFLWLNDELGFVITAHLYAALRRLRHPTESRFIWIDALCINQKDKIEKSDQVNQMGLIYKRAIRTVIWLGDMDESTPNCLKDRNELCCEPGLDANHAERAIRRKIQEDEKRSYETAHLNRVWWKRLWVVQEYAMSADTPVVLIGRHALGWKHFATIKWAMDERPIFEELRDNGNRQNLHELIQRTSKFACKHEVDKIFALLSLIDDDRCPLRADYTKPLEMIAAEAAEYMVHKHKTVDVLLDHTKKSRAEPPRAASWIPIWHGLRPIGFAKGKDNFRACSYPPEVSLHLREDQPSRVMDLQQGSAPDAVCSCLANTELSMRCLSFDSVAMTFNDGPSIHSLWNAADMKPITLHSCLKKIKYTQTRAISSSRTRPADIADMIRTDGLQTPCCIVKEFGLSDLRPAKLELDRFPNIGYLMLEYIFDATVSLIDINTFGLHKVASENVSQFDQPLLASYNFTSSKMVPPNKLALNLAKDLGFEEDQAVLEDLEVAYIWEEVFLWKMQRGPAAKKTSYNLTWGGARYNIPMTGALRRIFRTEDGFTGLGPPGMRPGDQVVVPFGSSRPWVLRNHGDHYVFLGDAIVPGIMTGRLETLHNHQKVETNDFVLR